jgi:hypothetical protein
VFKDAQVLDYFKKLKVEEQKCKDINSVATENKS